MSRSYKKPYWTQGYKSNARKKSKKETNNRVKNTEDIANGKAYRKVYNPWDIVDWKFEDKKNPKARRK